MTLVQRLCRAARNLVRVESSGHELSAELGQVLADSLACVGARERHAPPMQQPLQPPMQKDAPAIPLYSKCLRVIFCAEYTSVID